MKNNNRQISKLLSLILRHEPERFNLTLDTQGFVSISELLDALSVHGTDISIADLEQVVRENDKQRFAFSDDGLRIRANQGHSVPVDLGLKPCEPPELLFHGTGHRNLPLIKQTGLQPMSRQQVHLSATTKTAKNVGQRHGKPVVITVLAGMMYREGKRFWQAKNGVWLVDTVPLDYLRFP